MPEIKDWQYICIGCGKVTMAGADFAGSCPGCGGTRWLCHWLKGTTKPSEAQETGDKPSEAMIPQADNLSQPFETEQKNNGNKPGPKPLPVDDLVKKLAAQGLSSRVIATKLAERGIDVSYKTIQRRLRRVYYRR
jgi:predicted  nucleic acid-binding Zn-ribbon protein